MDIERILIAEEHAPGREFLAQTLTSLGYEVTAYAEGDAALSAFMKEDFDLVLVSEGLPGVTGLAFLQRVKEFDPAVPVVLLTDRGLGEDVVTALEGGVDDCFVRPFDIDRLRLLIEKVSHRRRLRREIDYLRGRQRQDEGAGAMVGESESLRHALRQARASAARSNPLLIFGERGTGKEMLARLVHQESDRSGGPLVTLRCEGLPEAMLESELFGHERGAFPGAHRRREGRIELAHRGTLVLLDVEAMPLSHQARLTRFLQRGRFSPSGGARIRTPDVRLIAITSEDLVRRTEAGSFHRGLLEALGDRALELPPLRQRPDDVPLILSHFLNSARQSAGARVTGVSPEAMELLVGYGWPGNVEELRLLVHRFVLLGLEDEVDTTRLPPEIAGDRMPGRDPFGALVGLSIHDIEREMILKTLDETGGNKTAAARILGLTARTLHNKLRLYREQGIIAPDAYRPQRRPEPSVPSRPTPLATDALVR